MEFLNPNFLIFIPIFVGLQILVTFLKKDKFFFQVSHLNSLKKVFGIRGNLIVILMKSFFFLSIVFLIIALARPRISSVNEDINIQVIDIILALDTSSSMLAEDFKPNRLEAVKAAANDFIINRKTDRIGLLVFGKETFIQCPLTIDYNVLTNLLSEVTVVEPKYDGTAIGIAIANAVNRLRNSDSENKVIILLSDGSNNSGEIDPISAAKIASEYNIKIYTIGAGTMANITSIPGRGLVRNEIDEKTLKGIANETGAKYFRATNKKSLEGIYSEIDNLEKSEITINYYSTYKEIYIWFLLIGFSCLAVSELIRIVYFRKII